MALHVYTCKNCGIEFEKLDFRFDGMCPFCGNSMEKKFSTFSWVFRGLFELMNEEDRGEA